MPSTVPPLCQSTVVNFPHFMEVEKHHAERIMRTVEENYKGVVIGGRRITNLRYADDTTLLASTQERIKKVFKDLIQESTLQHVY